MVSQCLHVLQHITNILPQAAKTPNQLSPGAKALSFLLLVAKQSSSCLGGLECRGVLGVFLPFHLQRYVISSMMSLKCARNGLEESLSLV